MDFNHQLSNLPLEIVFEIVSELPIKPLHRFKLVSKSWLAFINDLVVSGIRNKPQKVIIASNTCSFYTLSSQSPHDLVKLRSFPTEYSFQIIGSCNGIILLRSCNNFLLWNPLTRKHRLIESPCNYKRIRIEGLCYNSVTNDFKVVIVVIGERCFHGYNAYVFSCVSSSWTRIDDFRYGGFSGQESVVINGSPHWIRGHEGTQHVILYFDPREIKFGDLPLPFIGWVYSHFKLTVLNGGLCAISEDNINDTFDVWLLEDSTWSKLFVVPRRQGEFCARMLLPLCFVGKGGLNDKVVIQLDSCALALFNLKKKRFERIKLPSECASFTLACYEETFACP